MRSTLRVLELLALDAWLPAPPTGHEASIRKLRGIAALGLFWPAVTAYEDTV